MGIFTKRRLIGGTAVRKRTPATGPAQRPAAGPPTAKPKALYEFEPSSFGDGRGYVIRRRSDGQRLAWRSLPRKDGLEAVQVVGTSHRLDALQDPGFEVGQWLQLVPEPTNPHDRNAIGVWNRARTAQAGYIPKTDAKRLVRKLATGDFACFSLWETIKGRQRVALRVLIVNRAARVAWRPGE